MYIIWTPGGLLRCVNNTSQLLKGMYRDNINSGTARFYQYQKSFTRPYLFTVCDDNVTAKSSLISPITKDRRLHHRSLGRRIFIWAKVAELQEYHYRNISGEDITDDGRIRRNGSVRITTMGNKGDKEDYAQGAMIPQ